MKTCPVCGDVTFDDQPLCFGCLHRYETADARAPLAVSVDGCGGTCPLMQPLTLKVSLVPSGEGMDTIAWLCSIDREPT